MKNKQKGLAYRQAGFTLLELLVVIGIIGLLASILVVNLTSARRRARDTKRVADIKGIQTALEDYYGKNNEYPQYITTLTTDGFLPLRPRDPLSNTAVDCDTASSADCYWYQYYPATDPYSYHMGTSLEDSGSALLNQDRDCNSSVSAGTNCPVNAQYSPAGFNGIQLVGASNDSLGCDGGANRYCYDVAQ